MRATRRGFTLIELLVTIIGASVVIAGLASVVVQMLSDQKEIAVAREQAYARVHASGEISWTLKQAGRRGIRQMFTGFVREVDDPNLPLFSPPALFPGFDDTGPGTGVAWDGALAAVGRPYPGTFQSRGVITYVIDNYDHPDYRDTNGDTFGDQVAPLDPTKARTGLIYQYDTVVYRFERMMSDLGEARQPPAGKDPGDEDLSDRSFSGFNSKTAGQLALWINDPANRAQSEVLAVGVDRFEVNYVRDTIRSGACPTCPPANRWSIRWNLVFYKP